MTGNRVSHNGYDTTNVEKHLKENFFYIIMHIFNNGTGADYCKF